MQRQTTLANKETVKRNWYIVDAKGMQPGRLASEVAMILMGKNKPTYTPNVDCGDYVIIINAKEVKFTGDKLNNKKYYNASQYAGGLRIRTAKEMIDNYPVEMLERVVWGMLPKGRLGRQIYKKLFVYADANHGHEAQKPVQYNFKYIGGNK